MTTPSMTEHDVAAVEQLKEARAKIRVELSVIIGPNDVVDQTLADIHQNHSLLIGVPTTKTLLVSSLAETLKLDFKRIGYSDLMLMTLPVRR